MRWGSRRPARRGWEELAPASDKIRPMKRSGAVGALLLATPAWMVSAEVQEPASEAEVVLEGPLTRGQIEEALPDWVAATVAAEPDLAVARELPRVRRPDQVEVEVLLGTWCSDSRRELTRLWRALDESGPEPVFSIRYFGVARGLEQPAQVVEGKELRFVPTFIVRRAGSEVGRIVESSENGIESDLWALLDGRRQGVLSGRDDLGPETE